MTKIIVFDIDGTLADVTHRRHWVANSPKNWAAWNAAMSGDPVNEDIRWILMKLRRVPGSKTILCSGRGEENREVTEQWLSDNRIPYEDLYMRKAKDYRQDYTVKVELLARIRKEHGEPFMWFDDRQQVVDAIRAEGVRVLQVAPGDF
jgi:FMN phosphatase YigB (HAD superfamily)